MPSLPTEATDPALCGALRVAPAGGMHTGGGLAADGLKSGGMNSGGQNEALMLMGGAALLAAAGTGAVAARRARTRA